MAEARVSCAAADRPACRALVVSVSCLRLPVAPHLFLTLRCWLQNYAPLWKRACQAEAGARCVLPGGQEKSFLSSPPSRMGTSFARLMESWGAG